MNNNDILIRLRYALDIKDSDLVTIFKKGGVELTKEEVKELLTKVDNQEEVTEGEFQKTEYLKKCSNQLLESFLNGFIVVQRGPQKVKPGEVVKPVAYTLTHQNVNNVMLKKLKIALELTSDEMLEIMLEAGLTISKSELGAVLRKEGQRNYKQCGDRYARNFLKGLTLRYRQ